MERQSDPAVALTVFDVCYRSPLDAELSTAVQRLLSEGRVLTVAHSRPAIDVARVADETGADVVVVVDESQVAQGYVFPNWVTSQVLRYENQAIDSLRAAVDALEIDVRAAATMRGDLRTRLNFERPSLNFCPGKPPGSGGHYTFGAIPCMRHR